MTPEQKRNDPDANDHRSGSTPKGRLPRWRRRGSLTGELDIVWLLGVIAPCILPVALYYLPQMLIGRRAGALTGAH